MLYNLHVLRVIAALGVVYFHTTSTAGLNLEWDVGSRGVDVFFVISGFIIAYIGTGKAKHFFRRRLIRIVPFYWAASLVVYAVALVAPNVFRSTIADPTHLVTSLAFVPHMDHTGEMHPTLRLGWSLNFEMFFYVLFAAGLLVSPRRAPLLCVGAIVAFVLAVHTLRPQNDILEFYARPIVLEFCFGVLVYYIFKWCADRTEQLARLGALKWLLVIVLVVSLVLINVFEELYPDTPRYLAAGIPSFFIVLSALLLERVWRITTKNKTIYLLGESSYIIYLVHPYIVFTVLRLLVKKRELSTPEEAAVVVGLLALTSVVSIAIHVWFEKPVMESLRKRFA